MDFANWALRASSKFTMGIKYQFYQGWFLTRSEIRKSQSPLIIYYMCYYSLEKILSSRLLSYIHIKLLYNEFHSSYARPAGGGQYILHSTPLARPTGSILLIHTCLRQQRGEHTEETGETVLLLCQKAYCVPVCTSSRIVWL